MADSIRAKNIDRGTCELCSNNPCQCIASIRNKIPHDKDREKDSGILKDVDLEHIRRGSE